MRLIYQNKYLIKYRALKPAIHGNLVGRKPLIHASFMSPTGSDTLFQLPLLTLSDTCISRGEHIFPVTIQSARCLLPRPWTEVSGVEE